MEAWMGDKGTLRLELLDGHGNRLAEEPVQCGLVDLRRAGMWNFFAKSGRTRYPNRKSVMEFFLSLRELRQDRFFVDVDEEFHDQTVNGGADGLFHQVDESLHDPPHGF